MKSRLIGHGIDMGLIQPLPPPLPHTQGGFCWLWFPWSPMSYIKNMVPSDNCNFILQHTITYVLMLHFALLPHDNIANSMDELKILNIYERIFLRNAKFMFKVSKSVLPSYVNEIFSFQPFNETLQSLRSTGALDFYTPRPQKEIFKQSLIYSGPVIWNNLPDCLKNLETVDSFHRHCIQWMKSSLSFSLWNWSIMSVWK